MTSHGAPRSARPRAPSSTSTWAPALVARLAEAKTYGVAAALTACAVLASNHIGDAPRRPSFLVLLIPILVAAYSGGLWPGLFATVLASFAGSSFVVASQGESAVASRADRLEWLLLSVIGMAVSFAMYALHRRRHSAEAERHRYRNVFARQLQVSAEHARATRFQRFTRDAPIGIVFSSSDGTVQFANDEYLRIVGAPHGAEPPDQEQIPAPSWLCGDGEDRCERLFVRPDGTRVPVLVGISRQPDGFAAFVIDLTAEKDAQRERRESEERFRTLADNIAQLAWIADEKGRIFWHNKRWFDYAGAVPELMDEVASRSGVAPAHHDRIAEKIRHCLATGETWEDTFPLRASDGRQRWFLSRAVPIRDVCGNVLRWFGTSTDITELRDAEEELKQANRRKSEFLGVLSHELRNPLAPIRNSVYILDHCDPVGERARRAKAVIGRQVNHLTRLVDDLLDVTRIARGKIELRRRRENLNELVRRCAEDHRGTLHQHGLELALTVPAAEVWVDADATRLSQVIGNLLHNAAKFSPEGESVELELVAATGWAEIHVKDSGAGIAPDLLREVFEPFVQGEQSLARTQGGLGLGLALVKGLTELHGGSVRASSAGRGTGAEFVVRLPTVASGPRTARLAHGAALEHARRVRVLVVEDNPDVAESLAELVELLGHDVEIAHDGPAALTKARARPPDFVLCDIGLPGMSGFDVARAFRADEALHAAHLVAVTGYAQPEDRDEATRAGFELHVAKPADPSDIERLLAT